MPGLQIKTAAVPGMPAEGYNLWICGDYLVESIFPDSIANHFAFFFRSVRRMEQFDLDLFTGIFQVKARCGLSIRKDRGRSSTLRGRIKAVFNQD
jgi:hypothetical protein